MTDGKSVSKFSDSLVNIYRLNAFAKLKENKVIIFYNIIEKKK